MAYLVWQSDRRRHYLRLGPTDLWVVDVGAGLAARVTAPAPGRIHCLDWLDSDTLIPDRVETGYRYQSTLRRLEIKQPME